jgi:opacity protein-like surface antigen
MLRNALVLCLLVAPILSAGQDYPRAEIFGGYSYFHLDTQGVTGASLDQFCNSISPGTCPPGTFQVHPGLNGWNAAGQYNMNSWFGVKADVSGHYGTLLTATFPSQIVPPVFHFSAPPERSYNFLFGPAVSYRGHKYIPFAHGLLGVNHISFGNVVVAPGLPFPGPTISLNSETNFAFALGGGVDIKVSRHFLVRAGQVDYLEVSSSGNGSGHQNNFRFSAGVVYAVGGK